MVALTTQRLGRAGLTRTARACCADARRLPFADDSFDGAFMSFTLELFSTADQATVLGECRRVLRPRGRLAVVSLDKPERVTFMQRLYVWLHRHFPKAIDCQPIDVDGALRTAGFEPGDEKRISLWGLPVEIVAATLPKEDGEQTAPGSD
jgi:demethylmenaquinone methyltransferase/2-methoxy-6-polyprenyl-1,4-benzoquinol methylase